MRFRKFLAAAATKQMAPAASPSGMDGRRVMHRREFLQTLAVFGLGATGWSLTAAQAETINGPAALRVTESGVDLVIARTPVTIGGRKTSAVTVNGTVPGPLLRFREGEIATLRVINRLDKDDTSIHWHGLLVPQDMDGVPGISFPGIRPGETFTYRFRVRQNGTYWYHSHSAMQEQVGHYGPIIIEPAHADPVKYDREHIVLLSDWTYENPHRIMSRLKKQSDYYNFQQRTVGDFFRDAKRDGLRATLAERADWGRMRMSPADIQDVTGYTYTYLMNGAPAEANWTALFRPGERVRLRFINGSASTFFNVRIPGLELVVVQADGQDVQPVTVDEFQIAVAETYDVIVTPEEDRAYTIFAESMDRSGYTRGTLAPRAGMSAPVPPLRERPVRTMIDMGMDMGGMNHGDGQGRTPGAHSADGAATAQDGMSHANQVGTNAHQHHGQGGVAGESAMPGMTDMPGMDHGGGQGTQGMPGMEDAGPVVARHGPDAHGPGNAMVAEVQRNRLSEPGTGLAHVDHRVLVYADLKSLEPNQDRRPPEREIELHLTGNMDAFMWGIDGKKFSEAPEPIQLKYGERVRITLVNDTMMEHPMHLHGMFQQIQAGHGAHNPRKHTISVKPAERLSFDLTADEPGNWAFHCHFLYHMELGMFRFVNVPLPEKEVRS